MMMTVMIVYQDYATNPFCDIQFCYVYFVYSELFLGNYTHYATKQRMCRRLFYLNARV